jgi:predicted ester cyclase
MRKLQSAALVAAITAAAAVGVATAGDVANANPIVPQSATVLHDGTGSVAANIRVVESFLQDVIDEHHGDHAGRFLTADMEWHGGTVGTVKGRTNVAQLFAGVVTSLPDAHASIEDIFGQGNQVAVRVVVSGTQQGPLLGIPATGRSIHWDGVDMYRLNGGKISSIWAGDDWSAILFFTGTFKAPWIQ